MGGVLPLGQITRFWRGGDEIGALWHDGAEIWRKPAVAALSPATSNVMFIPNSITENRIRGNSWAGGNDGPYYPWATDFRPEAATGACLCAARDLLISSDLPGSSIKNRWEQPDTFWPVDLDPRRDLAGVEALVINQRMLNGIGLPYD